MRNQTLLQTTHTLWPLSTSHCSPYAQRSDADPTDANTLLITRADSANGNATANSITIQNYQAGQPGLALPGIAQGGNSCHRWQQRIAPKTIAACAYSMSTSGRFGLYFRPALGHAIAGGKLDKGFTAGNRAIPYQELSGPGERGFPQVRPMNRSRIAYE